MVPLPIVERELRVAARKRGTYFFRCAAVVVAGALCAWFSLTVYRHWQVSGEYLFRRIAWLLFGAAAAAGVFTTADCLSSEKRQGTLGLLFLTNLRGYQVVLGKLTATSLNTIYALVAVLPVLAFPILMGGVTYADVAFAAAALGVMLFISLSVGLLVSALSTSEFEAILGTVLVMAGVLVVPQFLSFLLELVAPQHATPQGVLWLVLHVMNPYELMKLALSNHHNLSVTAVYHIFIPAASVGFVALWSASLIVRRSFRDGYGDMSEPMRKLWNRYRNALRSHPAPAGPPRSVSVKFHRYRRGLLDLNPMLWLVNREPLRVKYIWFIIGVFTFVWCVGFLFARRVWLDWGMTVFFAVFLNVSLKLLLAAESSRQLAEDRKSGALELILSTPMSESDVLAGYLKAMQRQFAKPIIFVVMAELLLIWAGYVHRPNQPLDEGIFIFITGVMLVFDAMALAVMGIWSGLSSPAGGRATIRSILLLLVLPCLVAYPLVFLLEHFRVPVLWSLISSTYSGWRYLDEEKMWIAWLVLVVAYDCWWIVRIRRRLKGSLREIVARAYAGD